MIYEVVRYEPKDFRQRKVMPDGSRVWKMEGVARVPYRLPEVISASTVWICEGEKDADNLAALGITATCNAGGAGKWDAAWNQYFAEKDVILCGDNDEPGRKHMDTVEVDLKSVAKSVKRVTLPDPAKDISDHLEGLSDTEATDAIEKLLSIPNPLDALLNSRRFDLSSPPPAARAIYGVGAATIATPGNLTVIAAQAKAGKSALVGAFIAAATGQQGDTLGIVSSNPDSRALIHFDTEQSPADHHGIVATSLRRVNVTTQPSWLRSYRIADVGMRDRFGLLEYELDRAKREHGGIHSVILDGVADLINDPNDSTEAFAAVDRLHRLSVTYDTSIACVLHFNPGGQFGDKTRGHLGSQLERKAETNLALEKIDGVTVVYTKMARHAHIEKSGGTRFQWDADAGMHITVASIGTERLSAKLDGMRRMIADIFVGSGKSSFRHKDLVDAIMAHQSVEERTAKTRINQATKAGLLSHHSEMGMYSKGNK